MNTRRIGTAKERLAADYLRDKGYKILEMNYKCKFGEIDIIAKSGKTYVFVEVKYRGSRDYGFPAEAVDFKKRFRMSNASVRYLFEKHKPMSTPCRFDVIEVSGYAMNHIENAFYYCGSFEV